MVPFYAFGEAARITPDKTTDLDTVNVEGPRVDCGKEGVVVMKLPVNVCADRGRARLC